MSTASSPPSAPARRPWYLLVALIAAWVYGAWLLGDGFEELSFYRGERIDIHEVADSIPAAAARDSAVAAGERWLEVKEQAKSREMPFGVASLLLGAAMVLLAARSLAGREGSRSALVQVVLVHAGVMVAAYVVTKDVAVAETAFRSRLGEGMHPWLIPHFVDAAELRRSEASTPLMVVLMRAAFSGLIALALTRPRARAFFRHAAPRQLDEG